MLRIISKRLLNDVSIRFTSTSAHGEVQSQSNPKTVSFSLPNADRATLNPDNFANYRQHSAIDGFYWRSPYGKITVPDLTLDQYVWRNLAKWPNKVAIVCGITGRQYTFAELRDRCAAVAHRLRTEYALQRGDVVAISMTNEPEYVIAVLGAIEAGLTVTTINPAYTKHEHIKQLVMSNAKLIFGLAQRADLLRASVAQVAIEQKTGVEMPVVVLRTNREETMPTGVRDFAELMSLAAINLGSLPAAGHQAADIVLIPFSSGTTGLPKGVQLTHRNIASNCEMISAPLPDERIVRPTSGDFQEIVPAVLPFFHIYGFTVLIVSKITRGCQMVTLPRFEPVSFLNVLEERRATILYIAPPVLLFLANDKRAQRKHLAHMHKIINGAAPCGASVVEQLRDQKASSSFQFLQGYGMTESSPATTFSTLPNTNYGSIGRPLSEVDLKIVRIAEDDATAPVDFLGVDANVEGELFVRGPHVMHGYLNNPEATAATITPDGWLRTGDLATYNENGLIFIHDRVKELIKVNGFQVAPAELEELLRSHPLVLDAAVIGVKDERSGEVPRAFVAVRPGISPAELQSFVAERVVKYKWLTGGVEFVNAVPRSATGKILRRQLR